MSLELAWPWVLASLPLPFVVYFLLPRGEARPANALRVPFFAAVASTGEGKTRPRQRHTLLAALAWLLLLLAAARPQLVGEPVPVKGRDLMLAVDISGSMAQADMVLGDRIVDRLTAVKAVAGDFIERREGDRIGLILFGSQAFQQAPLTYDRATVRYLLMDAAVGLAGRETAIGEAIGLAVKRLRDQASAHRVLVLLTDGANTAGSVGPAKAAELAAALGLRIYSIGVGAEQRGPWGLATGARIDERTLTAVAEATGGRYFRARDIDGLQAIYRTLDELEPVAGRGQTYRPFRDVYQWPLAAALLTSALLAAAAGRRATPAGLADVPEGGEG